ncbi:MAG: SpoIID/LytB domain-containing protein [Patescibacteria group bacterium]
MKKLMTASLVVGILGLTHWGVGLAYAQTSGLKAEVVSTNSPLTLKAGTTEEVIIAVKNTGTRTWTNTGETSVNLGTTKPRDRKSSMATASWLDTNRPVTMQETTVAPNEVAHFQFPIVAAGSGKMTERFDVVMERVGWMGLEIPIVVNVQPAAWQGALVSQSVSSIELKARETATVTVRVKNTGDVNWSKSGATAVKVGTYRDRSSALYHASWLSRNRVTTAGSDIALGAEGEFSFTIQAPATVGTIREEFRLVAEGITWMSVGFNLTVKVVPAVWSAQYVGQSSDNVSMSPGDSLNVWVDFKNTGNTTWRGEGETGVKLGTARLLDRVSSFKADGWLSPNRVTYVTPSEVKPGEVGRFSFSLQAPNKIGNYREYFKPVAERIAWLPGEMYWDIAVEEELVLKDPIRVGLTSTTDSITVQGDSFVIRRGSDKGLVRKVQGGSATAVAFSGGYNLNTGEQVNDYLRFIPLNQSLLTVQTGGIGSSYNTFRGIIEVRRSSLSGNVWVVNTLELEDYMKGIAEVPEGWPTEAQKAQMVAARTYAARKLGAPVADIFDLYDDTRDQVYYGYDYESSRPSLVAAAEATRGVIIKYGGQPISAYYFSDSGGYTANVEDVWSQTIPYLRAVPDPYAKPIEWTATLTQDYLQGRFDEALGIQPNTDVITNIQVTERFESSRIKTVLVTLQSGKTVPLTSKSFDYLTNNNDIKSMKFDVQPTGDLARPDFIFSGQGWGHGVGMAQWGAKNMALQGKTYQEILTYYYTGVTIGSR